jgi:hypothetical protein
MAQNEPSNSSNKQQGGIIVHQIIIDNVNLTFSKDIADEIANVVSKEKPVVLDAIGSALEWQVASEYADYLFLSGYEMRERNYHYCPQISVPNSSIKITLFPDHAKLQIAPWPLAA